MVDSYTCMYIEMTDCLRMMSPWYAFGNHFTNHYILQSTDHIMLSSSCKPFRQYIPTPDGHYSVVYVRHTSIIPSFIRLYIVLFPAGACWRHAYVVCWNAPLYQPVRDSRRCFMVCRFARQIHLTLCCVLFGWQKFILNINCWVMQPISVCRLQSCTLILSKSVNSIF